MEQETRTEVPLTKTAGVAVPFVVENTSRCMCPGCPVQSASQCVSDKMSQIGGSLANKLPEPADMPGEYCSTGNATCQDIDTSRVCSCFGCPVYSEYHLADGQPTCYYCRDGSFG